MTAYPFTDSDVKVTLTGYCLSFALPNGQAVTLSNDSKTELLEGAKDLFDHYLPIVVKSSISIKDEQLH